LGYRSRAYLVVWFVCLEDDNPNNKLKEKDVKKTTVFLLAITLVIFTSNSVFADSLLGKISTSLTLRNDYIVPKKDGESSFRHEVIAYWHSDLKDFGLGFGIDVQTTPKKDYTNSKFTATLNRGPYYLVLGMATDSAGNDFVHSGLWWIKSFKDICIALDLRWYQDIVGNGQSYNDNFLEVVQRFGKLGVGFNAVYDRWADAKNEWALFVARWSDMKLLLVSCWPAELVRNGARQIKANGLQAVIVSASTFV